MSIKDRSLFRADCEAEAFGIKIDARWFAGFGGKPDFKVVKLRPHLADALLCVSREKALDYCARLEKRGYPVTRIIPIHAERGNL